jgi:hypothetical protein
MITTTFGSEEAAVAPEGACSASPSAHATAAADRIGAIWMARLTV